MAGQVINNVFYIEPNYENADIKENSDGSVHIDMNQIDMENYCVVVDLSVEVPQRTSDMVQNGDNKIIHMIFSSGANGHRTSFFEGSKLTDNDGVVRNYLTTAPYQITTYADISEQEGICNGEMVGINSIDIAYNNYAVPEVSCYRSKGPCRKTGRSDVVGGGRTGSRSCTARIGLFPA